MHKFFQARSRKYFTISLTTTSPTNVLFAETYVIDTPKSSSSFFFFFNPNQGTQFTTYDRFKHNAFPQISSINFLFFLLKTTYNHTSLWFLLRFSLKKARMKGPLDRTKVVLRHLPHTISQSMLMEQIDARFSGRYNWFCFRFGKQRLGFYVHFH